MPTESQRLPDLDNCPDATGDRESILEIEDAVYVTPAGAQVHRSTDD